MLTGVKTLDDSNQQISVLLCGYIKDNESKLQLTIPTEISQIILNYFKLNQFKFDRNWIYSIFIW